MAHERRRGTVAWMAVRAVPRSAVLISWFVAFGLLLGVGIVLGSIGAWLAALGRAETTPDAIPYAAAVAATVGAGLLAVAVGLLVGAILPPLPAIVAGDRGRGGRRWPPPIVATPGGLPSPTGGIGLLAHLDGDGPTGRPTRCDRRARRWPRPRSSSPWPCMGLERSRPVTAAGLGRSPASAWGILVVASLGVFLGGAELMVVAIALPSIVGDFGGWSDLAHASWIVNAYLLAYVVAMPLAGRAADLWGARRLYLVALGRSSASAASAPACRASPARRPGSTG